MSLIFKTSQWYVQGVYFWGTYPCSDFRVHSSQCVNGWLPQPMNNDAEVNLKSAKRNKIICIGIQWCNRCYLYSFLTHRADLYICPTTTIRPHKIYLQKRSGPPKEIRQDRLLLTYSVVVLSSHDPIYQDTPYSNPTYIYYNIKTK